MLDLHRKRRNEMARGNFSDLEAARKMASGKGGMKKMSREFLTAISMLKDSFRGRYKLKGWVIALIMASVAYLINPADAVPDPIPVAGLVDDAAVIASMLATISSILERYKNWKAGRA
jgi:uncharacterized membrane protein YkvA (DUF1232 family)